MQVFGQDAFGLGRADAVVATANNPSAVFYNPAGITQLPGQQVRLGTYALTYQTDYRSPSGAESHSSREFQAAPQIFWTASLTNYPITFGVGLYAPFGLSMKWPENTGFRSVALDGKIAYMTLQPVVAWKIHSTFSIGAGPTINYSQANLSQGLSPFPGNDGFRFRGEAFAPGFTAGLRWQPWESHSFGLVYRSATEMDYGGHTETAALLPAAFFLRQDAQAEFEFPQSVTAGWSWRPTEKWNLEFDAQWMDWASFDTVPIRQTTVVPPLVLSLFRNLPVNFHWLG